MASLLKAPVIFIVENNGVAMGTQVERSSAEKDLAERGCGFNMPHCNIDGNDVDTVIAEIGKAVDRARKGEGPSYIVANTYRFRGHSMSDPMKYRTKEEIEKAKLRDPITLYESPPARAGLINDEQVEAMEEEVADERRRGRASRPTPTRTRRWKTGSTTSWRRHTRSEMKESSRVASSQ